MHLKSHVRAMSSEHSPPTLAVGADESRCGGSLGRGDDRADRRPAGQPTTTEGGESQMSAESVSPITTYFRVCDGVRVRFADTKADSDVTVLLLAPWPESLWAFRRIWDRITSLGRVVAIDMPGFGHSDQPAELIAPESSG